MTHDIHPPDPVRTAKTHLNALGPQRVWSLLVTVFGDLAQNDGDGIEGPVLSALMNGMNIKPEAVRVALHRLRNDLWIASNKTGRTSVHALTATGRANSAKASPRIYSALEDMPTKWQVVLTKDNSTAQKNAMTDLGFVQLTARVFLGALDNPAPQDALSLPANHAPDWLKAQFEPPKLVQDYTALFDILSQLDTTLPPPEQLSANDVAVLRCLIVHSWRRLVLRHPALPRDLYSQEWRGHDCRHLVNGLLTRLPKPKLAHIADK